MMCIGIQNDIVKNMALLEVLEQVISIVDMLFQRCYFGNNVGNKQNYLMKGQEKNILIV